jgi:hypothetical protein
VFARCLTEGGYGEEQRAEMIECFNEIVDSLSEEEAACE